MGVWSLVHQIAEALQNVVGAGEELQTIPMRPVDALVLIFSELGRKSYHAGLQATQGISVLSFMAAWAGFGHYQWPSPACLQG